ncbi:hypothetical protein VZT92_004374 [Zoarces viviparus]|uniref:Uncharacterized protein n=1 Tax=Zoarces viviparus TaxID=48416 RepID=A0AAW1FY45_ZOAVI
METALLEASVRQNDESYVFGSHAHPFFGFLAQGQFGSGWWNSSAGTKLKRTKAQRRLQPSRASCSGSLEECDVVRDVPD